MDVDCLLPWQLMSREYCMLAFFVTIGLFVVFSFSSKFFKENKVIKNLSYGLFWTFLAVSALWASLELSFSVFTAMNYIWGILAIVLFLILIFSFFAFAVSGIENKNGFLWGIMLVCSAFGSVFLYSKSTEILKSNCSQSQTHISEPPFL